MRHIFTTYRDLYEEVSDFDAEVRNQCERLEIPYNEHLGRYAGGFQSRGGDVYSAYEGELFGQRAIVWLIWKPYVGLEAYAVVERQKVTGTGAPQTVFEKSKLLDYSAGNLRAALQRDYYAEREFSAEEGDIDAREEWVDEQTYRYELQLWTEWTRRVATQ